MIQPPNINDLSALEEALRTFGEACGRASSGMRVALTQHSKSGKQRALARREMRRREKHRNTP